MVGRGVAGVIRCADFSLDTARDVVANGCLFGSLEAEKDMTVKGLLDFVSSFDGENCLLVCPFSVVEMDVEGFGPTACVSVFTTVFSTGMTTAVDRPLLKGLVVVCCVCLVLCVVYLNLRCCVLLAVLLKRGCMCCGVCILRWFTLPGIMICLKGPGGMLRDLAMVVVALGTFLEVSAFCLVGGVVMEVDDCVDSLKETDEEVVLGKVLFICVWVAAEPLVLRFLFFHSSDLSPSCTSRFLLSPSCPLPGEAPGGWVTFQLLGKRKG